MIMKPIAAFIFLFLGSILLAQDTVTLINGRQIEGVITSESTRNVVVEMQGLKLTLDTREISKIERMDPTKRAEAIKRIKAPRPHEEDYYPESARPLFHDLQTLENLKSEWLKTTRKAEGLKKQLSQTDAEVSRLKRMVKNSKKLLNGFTTNPDDSALINNKRIENHNRLVNQTNRYIDQIRRAMTRAEHLRRHISDSYSEVEIKRKRYARMARRAGRKWLLFSKAYPDEPATEWFGELSRQIHRHPVAFELNSETDQPPYVLNEEGSRDYSLPKDRSGHFFVTATLNQVQIVDFMMDTGATFCVLPESVGNAAGARTVGPPVKTKVADGRVVNVIPAVLDEMVIYGQSFQDVVVGLMPDQGPHHIPNLLGMNVISKIPIRLTPDGLVMTIRPDDKK